MPDEGEYIVWLIRPSRSTAHAVEYRQWKYGADTVTVCGVHGADWQAADPGDARCPDCDRAVS